MKEIYYILDDNDIVIDFTEETTTFLYGTIPKDMTIEELKTILEFDNHIYTFENNVLTSVAKPQNNAVILKLQQENEALRKQVEQNKKIAERNANMTKNSVFELTSFVDKLAQHVGLNLGDNENAEEDSYDDKITDNETKGGNE